MSTSTLNGIEPTGDGLANLMASVSALNFVRLRQLIWALCITRGIVFHKNL